MSSCCNVIMLQCHHVASLWHYRHLAILLAHCHWPSFDFTTHRGIATFSLAHGVCLSFFLEWRIHKVVTGLCFLFKWVLMAQLMTCFHLFFEGRVLIEWSVH